MACCDVVEVAEALQAEALQAPGRERLERALTETCKCRGVSRVNFTSLKIAEAKQMKLCGPNKIQVGLIRRQTHRCSEGHLGVVLAVP